MVCRWSAGPRNMG